MIHEISEAQGEKMPEIDSTEKEQYKRRWNQRLYGLADIKAQVVDICCAVLPELTSKTQEDVDVEHKLERKLEVNATRGLTVTIQFLSRSLKDMLQKATKSSSYFRSKELGFGEELTTMDKAMRKQLWPKVEAARQVGKKAYFVSV